MSWHGGARLFAEIAEAAMELDDEGMTYDLRRALYEALIPIFVDADCADLGHLYGETDEAYDEAYANLYPERVEQLLEEDEEMEREDEH
jgi:hypothetical protein